MNRITLTCDTKINTNGFRAYFSNLRGFEPDSKEIERLETDCAIYRKAVNDLEQDAELARMAIDDLNVQCKFWRQAAEHAVQGWNALEEKVEAAREALAAIEGNVDAVRELLGGLDEWAPPPDLERPSVQPVKYSEADADAHGGRYKEPT